MHITEWTSGVYYKPGDIVSFQGRNYKNIQGHTAQTDWAPPLVPALWGVQGPSSYGGMPGMPAPATGHYDPPPWIPPVPVMGMRPNPTPFPGIPPTPQYDNRPGFEPVKPPFPAPIERSFPVQEPSIPSPVPGYGGGPPPPSYSSHQGQRYQSSAEWIEDSKRRASEFNMYGPKGPLTWLLVESAGYIPSFAVQVGQTGDGTPLFIARNFHEGGLHIGWASRNGASLSWGGAEIPLTTYEVLTGDVNSITWEPNRPNPTGRPVEAGYEADGKPLWAAQARFHGAILAGKASGWNTGAYVGLEGGEHQIMEYNVLVHR
ncbi:hypothetical protein FRB95_012657 [Tulasnella sp. JGI-2019a]|nr:hypothetical protein FRB95_012657 [Tulasnella sp. JGI-2019a]